MRRSRCWSTLFVTLVLNGSPGIVGAAPTDSESDPAGSSVELAEPLPNEPTQEAQAVRRQRTFVWGELNLVGAYSSSDERIDSTPRPQRSSVGFEVAGVRRREFSRVAAPAGRLAGVRFDVHPLLIYDPIDNAVELVVHDAWLQLDLTDRRQTKLKLGHFLIPFGQNPVLEPRGFFLLPLTSKDLGFKRDWGLSAQRGVGNHALEVALTAGSGLGVHLMDGSYLLTARLGTPTYKDLQVGISILAGRVPEIRAEELLSTEPLSRWRFAGDGIYKLGTYTVLKAEVAAGRDRDTPVAGYQFGFDYIPPRAQDLEIKSQISSWFNDLDDRSSDDTDLTVGLSYSLNTVTSLSAYYMVDLHRADSGEDHRLFLQMHIFSRIHS